MYRNYLKISPPTSLPSDTFNSSETGCTTFLSRSLKYYEIDPLVMIGSLNQVSPVVTIYLDSYRLHFVPLSTYHSTAGDSLFTYLICDSMIMILELFVWVQSVSSIHIAFVYIYLYSGLNIIYRGPDLLYMPITESLLQSLCKRWHPGPLVLW